MPKKKAKPNYPQSVLYVPTAILKAAQQVTTDGSDPRHLLRGVCIATDGYVQSTNGMAAFRARSKTQSLFWVDEQQVIYIHSKLPSSHDSSEIEWSDEHGGIIRCVDTDGKKSDVLVAFEVLTERQAVKRKSNPITAELYPDIKTIVPSGPVVPTERIGISSDQLALPNKVFGKGGVIFEHRGPDQPLVGYPLSARWDSYDACLVMALMSMLPEEDESKNNGQHTIDV